MGNCQKIIEKAGKSRQCNRKSWKNGYCWIHFLMNNNRPEPQEQILTNIDKNIFDIKNVLLNKKIKPWYENARLLFSIAVLGILLSFAGLFDFQSGVQDSTYSNEEYYNLPGTVYDLDGMPIQGVIVSLESSPETSLITDGYGGFMFKNVHAAVGETIHLNIRKDGKSRTFPVTFPGPAIIPII